MKHSPFVQQRNLFYIFTAFMIYECFMKNYHCNTFQMNVLRHTERRINFTIFTKNLILSLLVIVIF